jgi:hypothetical protein
MKLAFNSINSGLGNNGGSRTIIKCAENIEALGHRCDIIANVDNFNWFEHKPVINYLPEDLDVLIAVACSDVVPTLRANISKKAWYIRGHENWTMPDEQLGQLYNSGIFNIVNSRGLQQFLATYGADSKVVYQGIDFDWWEDRKFRPKHSIRIGCLYNKKTTKRWDDFVKLSETLGTKFYEYVGIGDTHRDDKFLTYFKANANREELNDIYSSCHIWFAPTELEGLHNVPIEAALCGCLIVCSDAPMNGMGFDYAFDNNTAMVYPARDINYAAELIRNPNWGVVERMDNHLRNNIGTRDDNMRKMIEYLENL